MDVEGPSTLSGNGAQSVESRSHPVRRHLDDGKFKLKSILLFLRVRCSVIVKFCEEFGFK